VGRKGRFNREGRVIEKRRKPLLTWGWDSAQLDTKLAVGQLPRL